MSSPLETRRSVVADSLYGLLNPIPFGCFVAALVFDIIYANSAEIQWDKGAAWLIVFGLLFAVVPRLINLTQVWISSPRAASGADRVDFWLNLAAIVTAIVNAFVHSRDAFGVVPTGLWLSVCSVFLLSVGRLVVAAASGSARGYLHG